jgi:septal ring factor EnvC (AmiA/AmiB activator)
MKPISKSIPLRRVMTTLSPLWMLACLAYADEKLTPTPKPGTLGAYAQRITLNRAAVNSTGPVVLRNSDVAAVAQGIEITLGSVDLETIVELRAPDSNGEAERERWTRAHHKQRQVIEGLNRRRSLLEIDVAVLDDQRPTPKLIARLEQARAKLRHIEKQIVHEKQVLARIVRQARRHGAQPDWFR